MDERQELLASLYQQTGGILAAAAARTLESMEAIRQVGKADCQSFGTLYPEDEFGEAMRTAARLLVADGGRCTAEGKLPRFLQLDIMTPKLGRGILFEAEWPLSIHFHGASHAHRTI